MGLIRSGSRAGIAGDFLSFLDQHPANEPASDEVRQAGARSLLRVARKSARPARIELIFSLAGSCVEERWRMRLFCGSPPLISATGVDAPLPHSLGALMAERFEAYKREAVSRFYEDHFRHYSRQIVLVDVLRRAACGARSLRGYAAARSRPSWTAFAMATVAMLSQAAVWPAYRQGSASPRPRPIMCRTSSAIILRNSCATWRRFPCST